MFLYLVLAFHRCGVSLAIVSGLCGAIRFGNRWHTPAKLINATPNCLEPEALSLSALRATFSIPRVADCVFLIAVGLALQVRAALDLRAGYHQNLSGWLPSRFFYQCCDDGSVGHMADVLP